MTKIQFNISDKISHTIKQLIYKNYYSAKAYHNFRIARLRSKEPLIVFQMGKVGSTTIVKSLEESKLEMSIYHTHVLTRDAINQVEKTSHAREHFSPILRARDARALHHLWESQFLLKQIENGLSHGKKWKVVSLVREPVSRNISEFFHNFDVDPFGTNQYKIKYFSRKQARTYNFEITYDQKDIEKLLDLFINTFNHDTPLIWFDSQLKPVFGVDVFSSNFPTSIGYKIYEGELADILLMRIENLNECYRDAFQEFLNIKEFNLKKANIANEKSYNIIYRKFLNSAIIPESYLDKMYTSKYAQHFYSQEEINTFRIKWHRPHLNRSLNRS